MSNEPASNEPASNESVGDPDVGADVLRRNNVRVVGQADGPWMMFSHGFGCDQEMWRFVAPHFEHDHRVVRYDHTGAGRSDLGAYSSDRYSTLHGYARDAVEIGQQLGITGGTFVGHSVAAMIGVLAHRAAPTMFDRLVLVAPSPRYLDDDGYVGGFSRSDIDELLDSLASNYLGWSATTAPAIVGRPDLPELGEELTESFCRTDPTIAEEFARVTFLSDHRDDLQHVEAPSLILQVAVDFLAQPAVGEFVHQQMPDSRLVVLDTSGHCPHLSVPDQVVAAIRDFVGR